MMKYLIAILSLLASLSSCAQINVEGSGLALDVTNRVDREAEGGTGEYFLVTPEFLAGLPNEPREVYVNNGVEFSGPATIADSVKLRFGPSGYLSTLPGATVSLGGDYEAPVYQWIFRGNGRFLQKKRCVYLSWFGATPDGEVDSDWNVVAGGTAGSPFKHAARRAKHALGSLRDWEIRIPAGTYIAADASQDVRSAYAGGDSEMYYKESKGSLSVFERYYNHGNTVYEVVDHGGFVLEDGAQVVAPNDYTNTTYWAVDVGLGYRDTNWDYDLAEVAPYDTTSASLGSTVIRFKDAADAARWGGRRKAFLSGGASYGDQQFGEQLRFDSIVGMNGYLREPLALDYFPSRNSNHGLTSAPFTQPAVNATVQVTLTKSPPVGPKGGQFSIGNDLYVLVSSDGANRYTVRNVGKGNQPAGALIAAGTRVLYRRALIHTPDAPEGFYVRGAGPGSVMVGRRDLIRASNLFDSEVGNMTLIYGKQGGKQKYNGLWLNADGYRNLHLHDLTIYSVSGRTEVGQAARSGTGLLIERVNFRDISLELTEFAKFSTLRDVVFDVDTLRAPFKPNYINAAMHIGVTTAHTVLENVTFRVANTNNAIGSSDIVQYGATAGGGLVTKNVKLYLSKVRTAVDVGPSGADLTGIIATGDVRELYGSVGQSPRPGTGSKTGVVQGGNTVVWSRGGPTKVGMTFTGNYDRIFGNYSSNVIGTVNAARHKSYEGADLPSSYSKSYGTVFHKDGPTGTPVRIQLTLNLDNFPIGLEREIKYPGSLGEYDYIRINCTQCPIYNKHEVYQGITKDTVICIGGGCKDLGVGLTPDTRDEPVINRNLPEKNVPMPDPISDQLRYGTIDEKRAGRMLLKTDELVG